LNTVPQDRKLQYQEECHLNYERMKPVCWPSLIRGGIRPLPPAGIGGLALTTYLWRRLGQGKTISPSLFAIANVQHRLCAMFGLGKLFYVALLYPPAPSLN
jgi:hypothetical protein